MAERYKSQILRHVAHEAYEPRRAEELAEELGVEEADRAGFREAVEQLIKAGQVVVGTSQTIALPPMGSEVVGRFKLHERGFGFLIPDTPNAHGDLFVPAPGNIGALTGDIVRAEVVRRDRRGPGGRSPYTGRIVEIIERRNTRFVGELKQKGKTYFVDVDGTALTDPVLVRDPGAKHARIGNKVVVELTRFPERNQLPEGVITEVLGQTGEPDVETAAICRAFDLPEKFAEAVLAEARAATHRYEGERESMLRGRLDLREHFLVTIDPPDAQDFDDAISIEPVGDGGFELGVHIADVAAFVRPGSALDEEAERRGNSAYLPRLVVPMLPEVLSNGVCSLQPGVDRLARSVFITYSPKGKVTKARFASSVIRSAHRLTYLEAQALIDGDEAEARKHAKTDAPHSERLAETLRQMDRLARIIRNRRLRDGMIVLDLPEVELLYDETGRVIDAQPEDDAFTHKIIEAFMVEANEAVARAFADLAVPLIRRTHPDPGPHDVSELRNFARVSGYNIPENPTRKELQQLLDAVRGKPAAKAVHFAVLRTLTKAEYSPALIGHFALASEHYTHFTSPIRRYPDLLVHRAMDALMEELGERRELPAGTKQRKALANRLRTEPRVLGEEELTALGRHCSGTERNAEAAERELRGLLVLQLLANHIGEEYPGTVTGVTGFGIFIQIDKYLVDGLIRTDGLPGAPAENWRLNRYTGSMTAERSGRSITIGDTFRVQIMKVDLSRREMDLTILDPPPATASPAAHRQRRKPRKNDQKPLKQKQRKGRHGRR